MQRLDQLLLALGQLLVDRLAAHVGRALALFEQLLVLLVRALHLVDQADDAAVRLFLVELVLFVLGVADDVLHPDLVIAQALTDIDDFAHRNGLERMAERISFSPSSMRLAISTSPSRVSKATLPIFRRYMRTGSFDL